MKTTYLISLMILVLTFMFTCSNGDSTNPKNSEVYYQYDIAQIVAESFNVNTSSGSYGEIKDIQYGVEQSENVSPTKGLQPEHFVTHENTWGSATHTILYSFYDAFDIEQTSYDTSTTAKVSFNATVVGSFSRTTPVKRTHEFTRQNNLTFTGLEGTNTSVILNGSGTCSSHHAFTSYDGTEQRYFDAEKTHTYSNVVLSTDYTNAPYPLSGTANYTINATKKKITDLAIKEREFQATAVVTFNGTDIPVVEVTISGVMKKFNMYLLNGSITEKL